MKKTNDQTESSGKTRRDLTLAVTGGAIVGLAVALASPAAWAYL